VEILEAPVPLMLGVNTVCELPTEAVKVRVRGEVVEVEGGRSEDGLFAGMREAVRRAYERGEVGEAQRVWWLELQEEVGKRSPTYLKYRQGKLPASSGLYDSIRLEVSTASATNEDKWIA
jgi:hypothetical protein